MKYKLLRKAYEVDLGRIEEGFLWGEVITHAETRGKAKLDLLSEIEGANHQFSGEEITYLNIPVIRCKSSDYFSFEGEEKTLRQIEEKLYERKRIEELNLILDDETIKYCYIIKRGEYYRPNSCGYTSFKHRAGVYTKKEAVNSSKSCGDLRIEPIDIEEHNKMIERESRELKEKILG